MSEQAGLSPGEVAEIVRHAGDAVVVGAQALAIWGQVLCVPVPVRGRVSSVRRP